MPLTYHPRFEEIYKATVGKFHNTKMMTAATAIFTEVAVASCRMWDNYPSSPLQYLGLLSYGCIDHIAKEFDKYNDMLENILDGESDFIGLDNDSEMGPYVGLYDSPAKDALEEVGAQMFEDNTDYFNTGSACNHSMWYHMGILRESSDWIRWGEY